MTPPPMPAASDTFTMGTGKKIEESLPVLTEQVAYYTKDGKLVYGFMARPATAGQFPGLVMIHEWWGLNENMKDLAKQYAGQGYVALAVDLYEGQAAATAAEAQTLATAVRNNTDGAMLNLGAAVNYMKSRPYVAAARIASVGWCFGGGWAYEMAKNNMGVKATVMYYGRFSPADDLSMMKSHIIGHFGANDISIKVDDVKQFQATLGKLSNEHEIYIYPNAGHGFANTVNAGYDEQSAQEAWERTLAFLKKEL